MNPIQFDDVTQMRIDTCLKMLQLKAAEYATTDRLHNFRLTASLRGCTLEQALAGMMAKHTISLYDMCAGRGQDVDSPLLWNEKITDHINYLLLLSAIIHEKFNPEDSNV